MEPTLPGWLKVNTNGVTFGSHGLAGNEGVFGTSCGFIKGCFAILVGFYFLFYAELVVVIHAILGPLVGANCGWIVILLFLCCHSF